MNLRNPSAVARAVGYRVDPKALLDYLKSASDNFAPLPSIELSAGMTQRKQPKRLWIVVKIESGAPVMADAFREKRSAAKRAEFLRQHMRPGSDEVRVLPIANPFYAR